MDQSMKKILFIFIVVALTDMLRAQIGNPLVVNTSFTRPANTVNYSAGQAVSNSASSPALMTFANVTTFKGGAYTITTFRVVTDSANTQGNFRVWFFSDSTSVTGTNKDGVALSTNLYNVRKQIIGYVDFAFQSDGASSSHDFSVFPPISGIVLTSSSSIYGILEYEGASTTYKGAVSQNFFFEVTFIQTK